MREKETEKDTDIRRERMLKKERVGWRDCCTRLICFRASNPIQELSLSVCNRKGVYIQHELM